MAGIDATASSGWAIKLIGYRNASWTRGALELAITLIPFMLIVTKYTVDAERSKGLKARFGIEISVEQRVRGRIDPVSSTDRDADHAGERQAERHHLPLAQRRRQFFEVFENLLRVHGASIDQIGMRITS